jgi:hypothetical protein
MRIWRRKHFRKVAGEEDGPDQGRMLEVDG